MKFKGKIKSIRYFRRRKTDFYPGALWSKRYFVGNDEIEINYYGIYDWQKEEYKKVQPRQFLNPYGQK